MSPGIAILAGLLAAMVNFGEAPQALAAAPPAPIDGADDFSRGRTMPLQRKAAAPEALPCPIRSAMDLTPLIKDLHIPGGMIFDTEDRLYIAEWGAARLCRYDEKGNRTLVSDQIGRPSGLAFDHEGTLYIASYDLGFIYAMNPKKHEAPKVIASGLNVPAGITWADDSLYIANRDAGEIIRLVRDGEKWKKILISQGHVQPVATWKRYDGSFVISSLSGGVEYLDAEGRVSVLCGSIHGSGISIVPDGRDAFIVSVINEGTVELINMKGERRILAKGFSTPMGIARRASGQLIVASWGERSAFEINGRQPGGRTPLSAVRAVEDRMKTDDQLPRTE
jgi:sugar lactone lactonase YvrE